MAPVIYDKEIQINRLPKQWTDEELSEVVIPYKEFRLFALRTAPDAFAATYEQEVEFADERWIQRLKNLNATQFLATFKDDKEPWKRSKWLGMIVLVHNELHTLNDFNQAKNVVSEQQLPDRLLQEVQYHMNAVFVDPMVQGKGLGKLLLQQTLEYAREDIKNRGYARAKVSTLLDSWNKVAYNLYQGQGFCETGSNDYIVGNSSRRAITMEQVLYPNT
jgi:GNAT superfamily N-acetyltransferase